MPTTVPAGPPAQQPRDPALQPRDPALQPRDPGLQPERTALSWSRTALAALVNALLVLRAGWVGERTSVVLLGAAMLGFAALLHAIGLRRRRRLASGRIPLAPSATTVLVAAAMTVAACLAALASLGAIPPR